MKIIKAIAIIFGFLVFQYSIAKTPQPEFNQFPTQALPGGDIQISGKGLTGSIHLTLKKAQGVEFEFPLSSQVEDNGTRLISMLPLEIEPGMYKLCISNVPCRDLTIQPEINTFNVLLPAREIYIGGRGLNSSIHLTLRKAQDQNFMRSLNSPQVKDNGTRLISTLPLDVGPGMYRLYVTNIPERYFDFTLGSRVELTVKNIFPRKIYNVKDQEIVLIADKAILPDHKPTISLRLGDKELKEDVQFVEKEKYDSKNVSRTGYGLFIYASAIRLTIPKGFTAGRYELNGELDGTPLKFDINQIIEVTEEKINAKISSVEPQQILSFSGKGITLTGINPYDIHSLQFGRSICVPELNGVEFYILANCVYKLDGSKLVITEGQYGEHESGDLPITIKFLDGQSLQSKQDNFPSIKVVSPAWPWNLESTTYFILTLLMIVGVGWFIFDQTILREEPILLQNQSAPSYGRLLSFLLTTISIGVSYTLIVGSISSFSWTFLFATLFVAINTLFPCCLAYTNGKFFEVAPAITRHALAVFFVVNAWFFAYFFTHHLLQPAGGLWINFLVLSITVTVGILGLRYTHKKLAEKRNYVTDAQIETRLEQILYTRGQANADTDLAELPRDRVITALSKYYADNRTNQGLTFDEKNSILFFNRHEEINDVSVAFENARTESNESNEAQPKKGLLDFIRTLFEHLNLENGTPYQLQLNNLTHSLYIFSAQASQLESILPSPFPIMVFISREAISNAELDELKSILNRLDVKNRFAIFIPLNEAEATRLRIEERLKNRRAFGAENIVVLGYKDIINILASSKLLIRESLMDVIQEQVDLTIFSPYRAESVTPLDMFYGRKREMGTILDTVEEGSIAILGTRRMGKTSLLQASRRELETRGKALFYLDCHAIFSYDDFYYEIEQRLSASGIPVTKLLKDFSVLVQDLRTLNPDRQIVFQFDEIDRLLSYDTQPENSERFFRKLRSLSQEKHCQFIFSGERTILDQLNNPQSAFFNFPKPVPLDLLDKPSTDDLVLTPMRLVGIKLEDQPKILNLIYAHTSGHPNLIQYLCEQCLDNISESKTRLLTEDIVLTESHKLPYRDKYVETFLSQAVLIEKAIATYVTEYEQTSETDLIQGLQTLGFDFSLDEIRRGIRYLMLGHVLTERNSSIISINSEKFKEYYLVIPFNLRIESLLREQKWNTSVREQINA